MAHLLVEVVDGHARQHKDKEGKAQVAEPAAPVHEQRQQEEGIEVAHAQGEKSEIVPSLRGADKELRFGGQREERQPEGAQAKARDPAPAGLSPFREERESAARSHAAQKGGKPGRDEARGRDELRPGHAGELEQPQGKPLGGDGAELVEAERKAQQRIEREACGIERTSRGKAGKGWQQARSQGAQRSPCAVPVRELDQKKAPEAGGPGHDGGLVGGEGAYAEHGRRGAAQERAPTPQGKMQCEHHEELRSRKGRCHPVIVPEIRHPRAARDYQRRGEERPGPGLWPPEQASAHAGRNQAGEGKELRPDGNLHVPGKEVQKGGEPAARATAGKQRDALLVAHVVVPQRKLRQVKEEDNRGHRKRGEKSLAPRKGNGAPLRQANIALFRGSRGDMLHGRALFGWHGAVKKQWMRPRSRGRNARCAQRRCGCGWIPCSPPLR